MRTKLITSALCIMVAVGGAFAQSSKPTREMNHGKNTGMMRNKLKLTDEQKASIQKIKFDLMQKQIDIRAKIAHARLDYEQLTSADAPNEDAITSNIDDISKLQLEPQEEPSRRLVCSEQGPDP